ncbi:MAG: PDZ domain-containing protein, partial [Candidatus Acidiferrales bacterium]
EIPYQNFFNAAGLELKVETQKSADFGFWTPGQGLPVIVSQVVPGASAEAAGLKAGDILLAINGQPLPRSLPAWLREHAPGEKIKITIHREQKDLNIIFELGEIDSRKFSILEMPSSTEEQQRLRDGWLKGTTN